MGTAVPITIDFETKPIESRPDYPPVPVGVAFWWPGGRPYYLAWGHAAGGNNSTKAEARKHLTKAWRSGRPLLFHNCKFDLAVAEAFFARSIPPWERVHDTTFLAFLDDPNSQKVSLKPLAERLLGMKQEEKDAVDEWLKKHGPPEVRRLGPKKRGAHLWLAPGDLVADYAIGDVVRTRKLYEYFVPRIRKASMEEAYDTERRLVPILLSMEDEGIPVDHRRLKRSEATWSQTIDHLDRWIYKRLGVKNFDVDANEDLADAMENADVVEEWVLTKTGKRSTAFDNLKECCLDEPLVHVLEYRAKLTNSVRTFARPWLKMAEGANGGSIYCNWNQVRQAQERRAGRAFGARTGRMSSDPNLMNIPRVPPPVVFTARDFKREVDLGNDPIRLLPELKRIQSVGQWQLPNLRDFIGGRNGLVVLNRDYSQQELRILAHYAGGVLLEAYLQDPNLDLHAHARKLINELLGTAFRRKPVKNTGFGIIYGSGIPKTAEQIGEDLETTKQLRNAYWSIFPGLKELIDELKRRGRKKEPIRTWGGRVYYVEEPREIKGRLRTFEYKLINTLIQGSAADCIKRAMINYYDDRQREGRLYLQVHDETVAGVEKKAARSEMVTLTRAMESVEFDVPMLTDGKAGRTWASAKPVRW
jgi:DNA polymerase-1